MPTERLGDRLPNEECRIGSVVEIERRKSVVKIVLRAYREARILSERNVRADKKILRLVRDFVV